MTFNPYQTQQAQVIVTVQRPDKTGALQPFTYTFQPHRMRIVVNDGGGTAFNDAKIEVFGVPLATMNQISRLMMEPLTPQNTDTVVINVWANNAWVPFWQGVITWAAVDASGTPAVKLVIEGNTSMALANVTASPYANPGPVLLQDALRSIVTPYGFAVDYSTSAPPYMLTDARATGTPLAQVGQLIRQFPDLTTSTNLQRIQVRKANAPYSTDEITISDATGKMGFPIYSSSALQFNTLFNPQIIPGKWLNVVSTFDYVNRTAWVANVLQHTLEVNLPGGQWTTAVAANNFGQKSLNP
jgi:hypothetical protein